MNSVNESRFYALTRYLTLLFILLGLGCSNEPEQEPDLLNFIQYKGSKYTLSKGLIINSDNADLGLTRTYIVLYSKGLVWLNSEKKFTGKGHSIHLNLWRTHSELIEGTYNYYYLPPTAGPYEQTLSTSSFTIDFNWDTNEGVFIYCKENSFVEIAEDEGVYTLTFTLIPLLTVGNVTSDDPVTGYFSGKLEIQN